MEFKDRLKKLRQERNISQQGLADSIYVSRSAVAKWENGLGIPNKTSYEALLEYFNITENELPLNEETETISVSKNRKIHRLSKTITILSLCLFFIFSMIANNIITTINCYKDRMRIEDFNVEYDREIRPNFDDANKLTGLHFSARSFPVNEIIEICYKEGYGEIFGEYTVFPQEGKFRTTDGEVFKVRIGECTMIHNVGGITFNFYICIFNRLGYLIAERNVVVTYGSGKLRPKNIEGFEKYWLAMQTPVSELKNT